MPICLRFLWLCWRGLNLFVVIVFDYLCLICICIDVLDCVLFSYVFVLVCVRACVFCLVVVILSCVYVCGCS